ncbi:MAG: hypothetical protein U0R70_07220 [Solirubrobacteraceae bacterium]
MESPAQAGERLRPAVRALNAEAYDRGPSRLRLEFAEIEQIAAAHGLHAWLLSDDVMDPRDGGYWRVFRLSPEAREADAGAGGVVIETAARRGLLPLFNLYVHDAVAASEGVAELRQRFPGS